MGASMRPQLTITDHAIHRYLERWGASSTTPEADLLRYVEGATQSGTRTCSRTGAEDAVFVHPDRPDIEFVVRDDRFDVETRVLVTVLPRSAAGLPRGSIAETMHRGHRSRGRRAA